MPSWKDLAALICDPNVTTHEMLARLNLRPSWLKRLLESKRLARYLRLVEEAEERKAAHRMAMTIDLAVARLGELAIQQDKPETARKACMDIMEQALHIFKEQCAAAEKDVPVRRPRRERVDAAAGTPDYGPPRLPAEGHDGWPGDPAAEGGRRSEFTALQTQPLGEQDVTSVADRAESAPTPTNLHAPARIGTNWREPARTGANRRGPARTGGDRGGPARTGGDRRRRSGSRHCRPGW